MTQTQPCIGLVGNPNCGKTTLFNALTGTRQRVGNWPGVTVERKSGQYLYDETEYEVVDLPGTYSVIADINGDSLDEQIAQQFILAKEADVIVNVLDASSLERGLYLTSQLFDAGTPMVVALNMMDVATNKGVQVDAHALAQMLGCPVIPLVASRGHGLTDLMAVVGMSLQQSETVVRPYGYAAHIESVLDSLNECLLSRDAMTTPLMATLLLEQNNVPDTFTGNLPDHVQLSLIQSRYDWVDQVCSKVVSESQITHKTLGERIDDIVLNRVLALPIFLGVMYVLFLFSINLGSAFIDFFDMTAAAIFVETPRWILTSIGSPDWLTAFIADGVGGGVQLVASFIPVIAALFLALSFLEDVGYMARAAFIIDRMMRSLGLPGKAFVPLIVGFGCNVPAVMATRTLSREGDRLVTTMMAPFMSCGARLTVYALFAAAFFPDNGQNIVFALYLIGIAVAVFTAFLLRRFMLPAQDSSFIMELPPYLLPTSRNLFMHTWHRLKGFVMRAGKAIVAVVIVLNVLNSVGTDGSFGNENQANSVLSEVGKAITPIFTPMGIEEDNWPATVGIFTGLFAKEVVVGTLDALYSTTDSTDGNFNLLDAVAEALATIPTNVMDVLGSLADPLGLDLGDLNDVHTIAASQEIHVTTLDALQTFFVNPWAAFCYLLFILLYMPCVATVGAIVKEHGHFWASFSMLWSFSIAYVLSVGVYQLAMWSMHPVSSTIWIAVLLAWQCIFTIWLLRTGKRQATRENLIPMMQVK